MGSILGRLPFTKARYGGFCRMTTFCKTFIPEEIKKRLEPIQNDDAAVRAYGCWR